MAYSRRNQFHLRCNNPKGDISKKSKKYMSIKYGATYLLLGKNYELIN
jgi:hypothetical protein